MTNPTNTDLADALREIANTLPLGSALVVRLAADRLGAEADGWIEWDASAPDSMDGPRLAGSTLVDAKFGDGSLCTNATVSFWKGSGVNNWCQREPGNTIVSYRVVK